MREIVVGQRREREWERAREVYLTQRQSRWKRHIRKSIESIRIKSEVVKKKRIFRWICDRNKWNFIQKSVNWGKPKRIAIRKSPSESTAKSINRWKVVRKSAPQKVFVAKQWTIFSSGLLQEGKKDEKGYLKTRKCMFETMCRKTKYKMWKTSKKTPSELGRKVFRFLEKYSKIEKSVPV